jgi:glutathione peroxidase-family protein
MFTKILLLLLLFVIVLASIGDAQNAGEVDNHESCEHWANAGECAKNPGYMLVNCKKSCQAVSATNSPPPVNSFYDIVETDIDGNEFKFDVFRGKVVYIINVASYCGYTEENYKMFRELKKYQSEGFVMVLAPCNAFGYQEPGDGVAIKAFAGKEAFNGIILSKAEVNGEHARPVFRYLKHVTSTPSIRWYVHTPQAYCQFRTCV